ncbi:peptidase C1B, bleomycin hydrolase [Radiomyces spectabilis]|uniref:peptidase C1B, bleomycin hydrolase n=1 Tax=Radiomyces spectabilis TaxID=64574 RepID=UPI00221E61BA|nr:peptidase C1B, bleomycin hydrolase [Radiomyces spectabilis]KAI8379400.1 peptidase C1B, bleomycin hydrolase [Radiomyces spectabilis]
MGAQPSKESSLHTNEKLVQRAHAQEESYSSSSEKHLCASMLSLDINDNPFKVGSAALTADNLSEFSKDFHKDGKNHLALNAVRANDPTEVMVNRNATLRDEHVFNVKLDLEGSATNQKSSGRCWLFAGTNVLRLKVIQKFNLSDDFELSQSYLFFYDKLEKANWFLENMIDLADENINSRVVQYLLQSPVGDGGQWDMFVNIVNKYGVVPKSVYPETYASSNSRRLNWIITVKLREYAAQIREYVEHGASVNSIRVLKESMMQNIYRIMVIFLGEPPSEFDWEATDKSGKYIGIHSLTPRKFFEDIVGYPVGETMSLINDPRNDQSKLYTVDRLGNVVGGSPVRYVNTSAAKMKQLAIKVLKSGAPVWFGCDVGQFSSNAYGVMDTDIFDYSLAFNVDFGLTKEQRLLYGESLMTHAMVFTGVHLDKNGQPVRWRVENSWGATSGDKGYWVMSDDWFTEFVYQVVLEKKAVPKDLVALLDTTPTVLPAYDPMGALALAN